MASINEKSKLYIAKKKLLTYATLTTLGTSVLTGCGYPRPSLDSYTVTDDGNVSFDGRISYEDLICYTPIKIIGKNDEERVFVAHKMVITNYSDPNNADECDYKDLLTNKIIIKTYETDLEYMELGNISDYLIGMEMIKNEYNQDDINKLVEYIGKCEEKDVVKVKERIVE